MTLSFFGPNPLSTVMELGAIKAVAAMAREMGDDQRAERLDNLFERAARRFDELCWQGEFYRQRLENVDEYPYQFGEGCLSDQLFGQTLAYLCGLGALLPKERLDSAVQAIYKYNFLAGEERKNCLQRLYLAGDEPGLVLCSWPNGGKPHFPFVYSDEVWTGIEYQVATLLVYQGKVDEAVELVSAVRRRFDGIRRSPWSEMECGFYYTRAMASWGLLIAMSGFECDASRGIMRFMPQQEKGQFFWAMKGAWGSVNFETNSVELKPGFGNLTLNAISIPGAERAQGISLNGARLDFENKNGTLELAETVRLTADDVLKIELN